MTHYGAGVGLDENFDFSVGSDGDLVGTDGPDEFAKDMAVLLTRAVESGTEISQPQYLQNGISGQPVQSDGFLRDVEIALSQVIQSDDRVDGIRAIDVTTSGTNKLSVRIDVVTVGETVQIANVFEL